MTLAGELFAIDDAIDVFRCNTLPLIKSYEMGYTGAHTQLQDDALKLLLRKLEECQVLAQLILNDKQLHTN